MKIDDIKSGYTVAHFKRSMLTVDELEKEPLKYLYEIVGIATTTDTDKKVVVYRALYGNKSLWVRPLEEFVSKVDRRKYPDCPCEQRFQVMFTHPLYWFS